jgi:hypothetical protein
LVREIVFQDEVVWIALFARPDSVSEFAAQARLMRSLRGRIPVPEIFSYSDLVDELGGRYLLMEGICGLRAEAEYFIFGIPDRYWNHVLQQLGEIMAEGMAITRDTFNIDGQEYRSDNAFWIDPARQNIRGALSEISKTRELFSAGQHREFVNRNLSHFELLFAELLYLCSEFLRPSRRPSNVLMKFPAALPPLRMENVIFDSDYNIKGLIGFLRAESVSSWDYFQYPYGLEETFDDPSMRRTVAWMREYFVGAWIRRQVSQGVNWDGFERREQWCQKDKVAVLYEFRKSKDRDTALLQRLLSCGYYINGPMTVDILYYAFITTMLSVCQQQPGSWDCKPDFFTDMFMRLLSLNSLQLHESAEQGRLLLRGTTVSRVMDDIIDVPQIGP